MSIMWTKTPQFHRQGKPGGQDRRSDDWRCAHRRTGCGPHHDNKSSGLLQLLSFREDAMRLLAIAGVAVTALLTVLSSAPVAAQQWPARSVKLMVPYPAGGNVDGAARIIADKLQAMLGQPVIIENKAGAGGLIAGEAFAKSTPDGYTLFVGANGPVLFAPEIAKRDAYNWKRDFVPITSISMTPLVLEVHPSVAAKDLEGVFRSRPPRARQADDGLARRRHHQPSAQRTRAVDARPAMGDGALPRQRARHQRSDRRPGAIRLRPDFGRPAVHQERQCARAGRHRQPPRLVDS